MLVPDGLHKDFTGHLTVGVPGTVGGMDELLRRYGSWSWKDMIEPAADLARRGVDRAAVAVRARWRTNADRLALYPTAAAQFLQNGEPYQAGDKLVQRDLARTLNKIAREGPDAFYRGEIARAIVAEMAHAPRTAGRRRAC